MCEHSSGYKMAKRYYDSGAWSKAMLKLLVEHKPQRLTEEEYEEITGAENGGQT